MTIISEFYLNKASYIALDSSGNRIMAKIDYWNGKFKVSKRNKELENYVVSLLKKKHRVNFAYKLQREKGGE